MRACPHREEASAESRWRQERVLVNLEETDRVRQRLQTKSGCLQLRQKPIEFLVAMRLRDTPVPIPNTMVKT